MNARTPIKQSTSADALAAPEPLIDENELERRTGVSASTWSKRRKSGHTMPFYKIGKNIRYRWSDVVAWLEANTKQRSTADTCADKQRRTRKRASTLERASL